MQNRKMTDSERALVEENIKLVNYVLKKYYTFGPEEYEDMEQNGYLGLCKAAMTFAPEKGYAFSTYAASCIINEIRMALRRTNSKCKPAILLSLDTPVKGTDGLTLEMCLESPATVESAAHYREVIHALRSLPGCEHEIICRAYAGETQDTIAKGLGISQSYTSRIIKKIKRQVLNYAGSAL